MTHSEPLQPETPPPDPAEPTANELSLVEQEPARTGFDWSIYGTATMAGLAVLIPIPLLDWLVESFFRRRIPSTVARRRNYDLDPQVRKLLLRKQFSIVTTCLLFPFKMLFELVKRLSRKIIYFLTVKDATDQVSHYWHQAFLIDHMIQQGHLDEISTARIASEAMEQALEGTATSPLSRLAGQIIIGPFRALRALFRFRRNKADKALEETRLQMLRRWVDYEEYLQTVAVLYDQIFVELSTTKEIENNDPPPLLTS